MLEPLFSNIAKLADITELYKKIYWRRCLIDGNVPMINIDANIS